MLSENTRVRAKIQSVFEQLALPHVAKVRCDDVKVILQIILYINLIYINVTEEFQTFLSRSNRVTVHSIVMYFF